MKSSFHFLVVGLIMMTSIEVLGQSVVKGKVLDQNGDPLPYVNVYLSNSLDGNVSDDRGLFEFRTQLDGTQILRASMIGMRTEERQIDLSENSLHEFEFVLRDELQDLEEAVASASSYATGEVANSSLETIEVVTTPGAAADLLLTIKTLPGLAMVDEGAGLFVRGGDVSETQILLDQASLSHPYRYESPTGGVMSSISPFLISGTYFSSGGFSARYGNALSGVLAMESLKAPQTRALQFGAGLAALSARIDVPLNDKFGLRLAGNRSHTGLMFDLNQQSTEFSTVPQSYDGSLSLYYNYRTSGSLKFYAYSNADKVGVGVEEASFEGDYVGISNSRLFNLQVTDILDNWLLRASASAGGFEQEQSFGALELKPEDRQAKLRVDLERPLSKWLELQTGVELEQQVFRYRGQVPLRSHVVNENSDVLILDERFSSSRLGVYSQLLGVVADRFQYTLGLRSDLGLQENKTKLKVDPRASFNYFLNESSNLSLAWGIYHQLPDPFSLNSETGNPGLDSQTAMHFILGLSHERDLFQYRLEAYYKSYDELVVENQELNYTNDGVGRARGIDAFVKYGQYLRTPISTWLSYSYVESERSQRRNLGREYEIELGPSPFDISHNLNLVTKLSLYNYISLGTAFRASSGRPHTPIIDAVRADEGAEYFLPIEAAVGSERISPFYRLDLNLSYYLPFNSNSNAVFYLAVNNVLNRRNVLGYRYSPDYSSREDRSSNFKRLFYFGINLNLQ